MTVYASKNFQSGAALRRAVENGVQVYAVDQSIGNPSGEVPDGECVISGPHYPAPHKFWVKVVVKDGVIVKVKR